MRTELVLIAAASMVGIYLLMLRGWRRRQQRQAFVPAPPVPAGVSSTVVGAVPGLFVGTTFAGDWLNRVAVHGLCDRARADLRLDTDGVHIDRDGAAEIYLPYSDVVDAAPGDRLAGKVMGADGLLILTWRLGDSVLNSAFRADDHSQHASLAQAIRGRRTVAA
ncbi:MAG: hypothetical protein NVS3B26_14580 [Mycobacteriales bacterium]